MEQTKISKVYESKPLRLQQLLDATLEVKKENRNLLQIISWWEKRRLFFNAILVLFGFLCIQLSHYFLNISSQEVVYSNDLILVAIVLFNATYSISCFSELLVKRDDFYGPNLFKKSLLFCIGISVIPTLFHFSKWLIQ